MDWDSIGLLAMAIGILGILLVPIGLGVWLSARSLRLIAEGCRAARWPHTTGTVVSVESVKSSESDARTVLVRYAYTVGEAVLEGTRIHPTYEGSDRVAVNAPLEAILVLGRKVRVSYRSDSPAESTLSVGYFSASLAGVFAGCSFWSMGAGLLLAFVFGEDGEAKSPASIAGVVLAIGGFMLSWVLTIGFHLRGNGSFAVGITVEG